MLARCAENDLLRSAVGKLEGQSEVRGQTPQIVRMREMIAKVGPTEATVLITGETGTGLLIPNVPRLTEWVYAGLAIDLLLAFYLRTWDKFDPILVMAFAFASYVLRRCMRKQVVDMKNTLGAVRHALSGRLQELLSRAANW